MDGVARDLAESWKVNAENERQKARREGANKTKLTLTIEKQRTELSLLAIKQMKLPGWTVARWERKTMAMKRALWQVANAKLYNIIYTCLDTGDGKKAGHTAIIKGADKGGERDGKVAWALVNGQFTQENGEGAVSIMTSMLAIQQTTESFDDIAAMVEAHKAQYSAVTQGQELDARLVKAIYRTKLAPKYEKGT